MSILLEKLQWRYATKKMDSTKSVAQDKVDRIIEAARLAPTSNGLQPFEIICITNPEIRSSIRFISSNQAQITEGSHLLVFAAWDTYTADRINYMFDLTNTERGFTNEGWENYRQYLLNTYPGRDSQTNFEHAARQAYLALGAALASAAFEEVDSTPMEGFHAPSVDDILDLHSKGLKSVAMMALGYRDPGQDWLASLKKVRKPLDKFVTMIK